MKNEILNSIIEERKGMYVHALELSNIYEFTNAIEDLTQEFKEYYTKEQIIEFFDTIKIYYIPENGEENEEEETKLYNFDIESYINLIL